MVTFLWWVQEIDLIALGSRYDGLFSVGKRHIVVFDEGFLVLCIGWLTWFLRTIVKVKPMLTEGCAEKLKILP